jgi:predicted NAD/FAD-dependent oxidoreductase
VSVRRPETVAIIGAGMAGATCARAMADAGVNVRLYDKGRSAGGRMAQRRVEQGVFDHGAQYFGARDPGFAERVAGWRRQGIVADWPEVSSAGGDPVLVGVPAMGAPVNALLADLEVTAGCRVTGLLAAAGGWTLTSEDGARHGPFGAAVLAVPAPQAVRLLAEVKESRAAPILLRLGAVQIAPCWSALLGFAGPLGLDLPSYRFRAGPVAWAARNRTKPGRGDDECWTLHAGPGWSREMLERQPEEIAPALLAAFAAVVPGALPLPTYQAAHRWRHALVERPLGEPCVWDPALRLGLCGDWCLGPRVEAAYLSGTALAAALVNDRSPL